MLANPYDETVETQPTNETRRYPRIAIEHPGELELRNDDGSGRKRTDRVPVLIRAVSCEGIGLHLCQRTEGLTIGRIVTIRFTVGRSNTMELPARVVWYRPAPDQRFDLGLRLQLEIAPAATRRNYAAWIVGGIAASRAGSSS